MSTGESYDFNKRQDFDYTHSFDYLGGVGLGRDVVEQDTLREKQRGKYDMQPVDPPSDLSKKDEVIRLARVVNSSQKRESLTQRIASAKDPRMEMIWNKSHELHSYFSWVLHCLDREVDNWDSIRSTGARKASPSTEKVDVVLREGDTVEITGLKSRPELNGKTGLIKSISGARYIVEFPDIDQSVSVASERCVRTNKIARSDSKHLPRGLKVDVVKLTSESGKLLNGMEGYVVEYKSDIQRYVVRLDLTGELKSLKEENLHACVPTGWEEKYDPSSGKPFYVRVGSKEVTWTHPILGKSQREKRAEPERSGEFTNTGETNESSDDDEVEENESEFSRTAFLEAERKRLRLDRREELGGGTNISKITERLSSLRAHFQLPQGADPIFIGLPSILVSNIQADRENRDKWLFVGLCLLLEDMRKLKFNKKQLFNLLDKIDQVDQLKSFEADMEDWIVGGLKLAAPISYSIQ